MRAFIDFYDSLEYYDNPRWADDYCPDNIEIEESPNTLWRNHSVLFTAPEKQTVANGDRV